MSKSRELLHAGAFDSMLAVSIDGVTYHPRYGYESFSIAEDKVTAVWKPLPSVTVETELIPIGVLHIRKHHLLTKTEIVVAEGGFAIASEGDGAYATRIDGKSAAVIAPWGTSGIKALDGYDTAEIVSPEPNTNLMAPRTLLPTLKASLSPGEHMLVCAVLGTVSSDPGQWQTIHEEGTDLA